MNTKTKALLLLSVIAVALVAGSLISVTQSLAKADPTASVATDSETTPHLLLTPPTMAQSILADSATDPWLWVWNPDIGHGDGPRGMDSGFGARSNTGKR